MHAGSGHYSYYYLIDLIMSNFIALRLILQEPKPDVRKFIEELSREELKKGDYDLLLRKAVESKVPDFRQFCDALVRKGANVNFFDSKDNVSNLMLACEKGNLEMASALLSYKHLNLLHPDKRQLNAAFYAIENRGREDSQSILRLLLEREGSLVSREAGNQTPLIAAIRKCKVELVKLLLEFKADPNWQVPDTGNTALHDAVKQLKSKASQANREIVRLLLVHGGDCMRRNKQQKTVYDYAEKALEELQMIERKAMQAKQKEVRVQTLLILDSQADMAAMLVEGGALFDRYEGVAERQEAMFLDEGEAYKGLNEEIYEMQRECIDEHQAAYKEIEAWLIKFDKVIAQEGLAAELIGSFATGLWIKNCNIDLLLVRKDPYDTGSVSKDVVERVYDSVKKAGIVKGCAFHNRSGRPLIKLEVEGKGGNRVIHITMMDRGNNSGRAISCFILQQKERYPILQPIFYVIKYLTYHYKLSQPKNGGLKTYALIIMLLSCIAKWNEADPGKLLVDFLYYFGFYYEYQYEINQNVNKVSLYPYDITEQDDQYLMALHILDPINPANNVGKHVKALELQRMFKTAYFALYLNIPVGRRLHTMFDSRKIILP